MVTILPPVKKSPSFVQRLSQGVGRGIEMGSQFMQEYEQKKLKETQSRQADKAIFSLTAEDSSEWPIEAKMNFLQEVTKQKAKYNQQSKFFEELGLGDFGKGEEGQKNDFVNQMQGNEQQRNGITAPEFGGAQGERSKKDQTNSDNEEINVKLQSLIPQKEILKWSLANPAVADKMQKYNDNLISEGRHQEKLMQRQREFEQRTEENSPEFRREAALTESQAKNDIDYNKQLQAAASQHEIKTQALNKLEKLNDKGVTGKPYEKLLEKFGLINLTSEGRREFAADVKTLITDIRSILGSQFTGFEFQTILNAYPSADFSKGANRAIIKNLKEFQDIRHKEFEISKDLKKENKGKIPPDFQSLVNDRLQEYTQSRLPDIKANTRKIMNEEYGIPEGNMLMFDPQGQPLNVPFEMIDEYEKLGATLP